MEGAAAAFVQTEGNAEREGGEEHRGNDFLPPFLPFSLPVASKRENVISIRHTCHEKVERRERERVRKEGRGRPREPHERGRDLEILWTKGTVNVRSRRSV